MIPFKPRSNKPVYCSDCFKRGEESPRERTNYSAEDLAKINQKLDKIMLALKIK